MMKERKSNFELLRVISMLMIVASHASHWGGYDLDSEFTINKFFIEFFYMLGEIGVNCFTLVTGYFLIHNEFKFKKILEIIGKTYFYVFLCNVILILFKEKTFRLSSFLFPVLRNKYWYITAYIELYLIFPFINILIKKGTEKAIKKMIYVLLIVNCFIPTVFCVFSTVNSEDFMFFNRLIWLIIIYIIGAYIRLYGYKDLLFLEKHKSILVTCSVFDVMYIIVTESIIKYTSVKFLDPLYFWSINSVTTLFISLSLLCIFIDTGIKQSKIINFISKGTLGIYLFHSGSMLEWIWQSAFNNYLFFDKAVFIPRIILSVLEVFTIGLIIETARRYLFTGIKKVLCFDFSKVCSKIDKFYNDLDC